MMITCRRKDPVQTVRMLSASWATTERSDTSVSSLMRRGMKMMRLKMRLVRRRRRKVIMVIGHPVIHVYHCHHHLDCH